jgi:hypothetical protein
LRNRVGAPHERRCAPRCKEHGDAGRDGPALQLSLVHENNSRSQRPRRLHRQESPRRGGVAAMQQAGIRAHGPAQAMRPRWPPSHGPCGPQWLSGHVGDARSIPTHQPVRGQRRPCALIDCSSAARTCFPFNPGPSGDGTEHPMRVRS